MSQKAVIEIRDLKQQFGKLEVLKGIDLDVERGEILGLLGPSGSGKTTLVKAIVGMGKPTSGKVKVLGRDRLHLAVGDLDIGMFLSSF
ncbi:MAG: hypothetical protein BAA01_15125 [Bacillus thermozeamaize]|uniref:ABC transporter domain-containing protein n=1 Tax=Bacillus thermozeamaize TaxID=230954 RepID=A0A1Y3PF27_9BACI|nr:MAG: hypothetical protein BAA01_15125 [Bacillus thermozeamaize]